MRDAELLDHAPGRRDHAPRRVAAAAQRLEDRLAAQRDGLDRGGSLSDPQHAHDIEAAAAGARHRARSPQRGDRRAGQHRVGAAPVAAAAGRGERPVERGLGRADLAEARQRERVHRVRLRLAGGVTGRRQLVGRGRNRVGGGAQRLRIGEDGELTGKAGVPGPQAVRTGGEPSELVDCTRCRADLASRQQRFAPVEGQIGAGRIGSVEPRERASEQARCERQVVARQRPPARRREVACRALAEAPTVRVDRSDLAQVLVRLLEVPPNGLVVLDRLPDPALQPVGEAPVELGARALQQAPVGRVADQHVMEAQRRLAEKRAGVGLDELAVPQRFEPRVEVGADLARQQVGDAPRARTACRRPRRVPGSCAPPGAAARCGQRAAPGWSAASPGRPARPRVIHRSPSRLSAPSCTSMRTSSPTNSGLPSLVASTRPATAAGSVVGADHAGGQPRRRAGVETGERHHVVHETIGGQQGRAAPRAAPVAPPPGPAAAPRCSTARDARRGRAAAARPTAGRRSRAPPAARPRARRASAGRRRRSLRATAACRRGAPRPRRRCGPARARLPGPPPRPPPAGRRHSRRRRCAGACAGRRRAARRRRRPPRRSGRSVPLPGLRDGARARRSAATCRGPAIRGSRPVARGASQPRCRRPP